MRRKDFILYHLIGLQFPRKNNDDHMYLLRIAKALVPGTNEHLQLYAKFYPYMLGYRELLVLLNFQGDLNTHTPQFTTLAWIITGISVNDFLLKEIPRLLWRSLLK